MFTAFMKVMYVGMYAFMGTSAVEKLEQVFSDMQKDRLTFGNKGTFKNYDIEFERVCFGYTDQMVLEDVSFTLKEGRSYALVGSSGGGKSTIAKLISGFYKVDGGAVKIGGEPIEAYTEDALIRNIAFVSHQYLRECPSGEPRRSKSGGHGSAASGRLRQHSG